MFQFQEIIIKWISNININELSHNSLVCRYFNIIQNWKIVWNEKIYSVEVMKNMTGVVFIRWNVRVVPKFILVKQVEALRFDLKNIWVI
jgi:hypothetical protein